jgi:DNA polymerase-4
MACRLTGTQQDVETAKILSNQIKITIRSKVGTSLCCSVGVAPNRYLAKIAADMKKPDGFTAIRPCDLPQILNRLSLRDLPGVGQKMEERLTAKRIYSMQQLCSMSAKEMSTAWGSIVGDEMWHLLRGEELHQKVSEQKSISHSHVLPPELRHETGALRVLKKLTAKAALRLRQDGRYAASLQIFVRFLGRDTWKARCGLMETQDTIDFIHAIGTLWKELPPGSMYAVGIVLGGLVPESFHSPSLFDDPRREKLTKILDKVNEKFGKDVIHYGAIHEAAELAPLRIAFTRIPDESEA